jgi:hypothetical protein
MGALYFSDREQGERPRVKEEIDENAWGGIVALVQSRIRDGSFGFRYPLSCADGHGPYGCDEDLFSQALKGEIPDLSWPPRSQWGSFTPAPPTLAVLDLIEFCYRAVAERVQIDYHQFFRHHHLEFYRERGQSSFRDDVNRILARSGFAYELHPDGLITRLAPEVLRQSMQTAAFRTGDADLDVMLEAARTKFLHPDFIVRGEALEKLWDAWERLKTIEPGADKAASVKRLRDRAADEPTFRQLLKDEAKSLMGAGNKFQIRHSKVTRVPLRVNEHVVYMFHRMFALIRLLLRMTSRGG